MIYRSILMVTLMFSSIVFQVSASEYDSDDDFKDRPSFPGAPDLNITDAADVSSQIAHELDENEKALSACRAVCDKLIEETTLKIEAGRLAILGFNGMLIYYDQLGIKEKYPLSKEDLGRCAEKAKQKWQGYKELLECYERVEFNLEQAIYLEMTNPMPKLIPILRKDCHTADGIKRNLLRFQATYEPYGSVLIDTYETLKNDLEVMQKHNSPLTGPIEGVFATVQYLYKAYKNDEATLTIAADTIKEMEAIDNIPVQVGGKIDPNSQWALMRDLLKFMQDFSQKPPAEAPLFFKFIYMFNLLNVSDDDHIDELFGQGKFKEFEEILRAQVTPMMTALYPILGAGGSYHDVLAKAEEQYVPLLYSIAHR